jgi:hypothetical protein
MYQYPEVTGLEADMLDAGPVAELARVAEDAGCGATWVIVPGRAGNRDDSVAFLERFGSQIAQHTGATS